MSTYHPNGPMYEALRVAARQTAQSRIQGLTIAQAAKLMGRPTNTLYRWISMGRLKAQQTPRGWRIQATSILSACLDTRIRVIVHTQEKGRGN